MPSHSLLLPLTEHAVQIQNNNTQATNCNYMISQSTGSTLVSIISSPRSVILQFGDLPCVWHVCHSPCRCSTWEVSFDIPLPDRQTPLGLGDGRNTLDILWVSQKAVLSCALPACVSSVWAQSTACTDACHKWYSTRRPHAAHSHHKSLIAATDSREATANSVSYLVCSDNSFITQHSTPHRPTSFSFSSMSSSQSNLGLLCKYWSLSSSSIRAKFFFRPQMPESPTSVGCLSKGQSTVLVPCPCNGSLVRHWWQTVWPQCNNLGTFSPCRENTSSHTRHSTCNKHDKSTVTYYHCKYITTEIHKKVVGFLITSMYSAIMHIFKLPICLARQLFQLQHPPCLTHPLTLQHIVQPKLAKLHCSLVGYSRCYRY